MSDIIEIEKFVRCPRAVGVPVELDGCKKCEYFVGVDNGGGVKCGWGDDGE